MERNKREKTKRGAREREQSALFEQWHHLGGTVASLAGSGARVARCRRWPNSRAGQYVISTTASVYCALPVTDLVFARFTRSASRSNGVHRGASVPFTCSNTLVERRTSGF